MLNNRKESTLTPLAPVTPKISLNKSSLCKMSQYITAHNKYSHHRMCIIPDHRTRIAHSQECLPVSAENAVLGGEHLDAVSVILDAQQRCPAGDCNSRLSVLLCGCGYGETYVL